MIASTKRYMTAFAAAALTAVAVSACGGGGPPNNGPPPTPMPEDVDLSGVTPGFTAGAGTVRISAGQSRDHGDVAFACAAGGDDCVIMVMVDSGGTVTAASTGGTVTAINSDEYDRRLSIIPEQREKEQAIHTELSRLILLSSGATSDFSGATISTSTNPASGSAHLQLQKSHRELYTFAVPWRDSNDALNFSMSLNGDELPADAVVDYHGRSISGSPDDLVSSHELGKNSQIDWQVFSTTKSYGDRSLEVQFVTDVQDSETPGQTWVGYEEGAAGQIILLDDIPSLRAGHDWQGISIGVGDTLPGSVNGTDGEFSCDGGQPCGLEIFVDGVSPG